MDKKITVTKWCNNRADSEALLRAWVTTNLNKISEAIKTKPWTSPCILGTDADSFVDELVKHGGKAFTTDCK